MNGEVLHHRIIRRQHTRNQCPKTNCRSVGKIGPTNKGTNTQHLETYNHRRIQMFSKKNIVFSAQWLLCTQFHSLPKVPLDFALRQWRRERVSAIFTAGDTTRLYGHVRWDSMGLYGTLWDYGFQRFPVLDFLAHLYTSALLCQAKTFSLRLRRKYQTDKCIKGW